MTHRRKSTGTAATDGAQDAWFVQRRYGYGATPIRWQGWALVAAYIVSMLSVGSSGLPVAALIALLGATTAAFIVITLQKTRGGWRWRWGGRD